MQETSSQSQPLPAMSLNDFLSALFRALDREGLRPCILRNYEGLPDINLGNDIDFFIRPSELPRAMRALASLEGIRIVGYSERRYVAVIFVEGVSPAPGIRMQHIDFNLSLTWKGLPYLSEDAVLGAAVTRHAGGLRFLVPTPVHEAIVSLFASLLVGGWLKEKYFPPVQQTFVRDRSETIAALSPQFGSKVATQLVNSVIDGDRRKILSCIRPLRLSLLLRSLLRSPFRSILAVIRHYARECAIRFSPKTLRTVCILDVASSGKSTVIESLMPLLRSAAVWIENSPSRLRIPLSKKSRGEAPAGWLVSMAGLLWWLGQEWLDQFIGRTNLTLRVRESSIADLLVDPGRHRYGGPVWFARLVSKLFPAPDLWILLDPAIGGSKSPGGDLLSADALRRIEAYRSFVKAQRNYVVLDASRPASAVTEDAYAAIIETFSGKVDRKLKKRF